MDLKRVIGVVVLILLVYYFKDSTSYILKANPLYFLLSILCYVSLNLILALRMKFILEKLGDKTGFSEVFKTHMASMITSDVTPGRSGYLAFPKFGERYGMNFHISTASLFSTQAVEMIVKVFGSSLAIAYLLSPEDLVALFVPAILTISASVYLWTDVIPIKIRRSYPVLTIGEMVALPHRSGSRRGRRKSGNGVAITPSSAGSKRVSCGP